MVFDKQYFERAFQDERWAYSLSKYEQVKYQRQLVTMKNYSPQAQSILEVGCGEGIYTSMLAEAFPAARILSVDLSSVALSRARQNCGRYVGVEFVEGDIVQLLDGGVLPKCAFDAVIQSEVLYYLFPRLLCSRNLTGYLRNVTASMKNGGVLVTSNGLNPVTTCVMQVYYRILKGLHCNPAHAATYREWNEVRNKHITYEIRVFRTAGKA